MVLPGYALMAQGTQIHIAAWPGREPAQAPPAPIAVWPRQLLLSRAFASQAGCYVILVGGLRSQEDVPAWSRDLATPSSQFTGDSCIIDPRGEVIAGLASGEQILIAQGSMEVVFSAKAGCDVTGHYSRPDIFQLLVNGQAVVPGAELNLSMVGNHIGPSSVADPVVSTAISTIEQESQS